MVHSTTHVANAHLHKRLPYDTLRDFATVSLLSAQTSALVVHPSLPVKSVKDFIALNRARPGDILYASSGNGSAPHMAMALFISMTGIKPVHLPYKGGAAQVTALISGEAHASISAISVVIAHVRSQRLRALGVNSLQRSATMPDVPTIAESAVPGYDMTSWVAVFAPAGTPGPIVERLNAEINKALALPGVRQSLASQALDPWITTQQEAETRIRTDYEKYAKLIKLTGAQLE
jgi:tripartite-type tricarboxylate transporter receptor subunit TctC